MWSSQPTSLLFKENRMRHTLICILLAASALAPYSATALDIQLPPETAVFKPSELPGYLLDRKSTRLNSSHRP